MFSYLHHKVRTTPWLGRAALKTIPNVKWHVNIEPIGAFSIRLREHRMFWLRPPLLHEDQMMSYLERLVRPGDVVYDVGANIGLYSRFLAQRFKAAHVYSFEPMESNCRLLAENVAIGGCASQVTIIHSAVGSEDGVTDFQVDDLTSNSGAMDVVTHGKASSSRAQYGLPPKTVQVKVTSLDTFVKQEGILKPQVIKIDIEGAEALALSGASRLLSEHKPHLLIELHGAEPARQVVQILWDHGYRCFGHLNVNGVNKYKEIVRDDLSSISERYSLPFVAASQTPQNLVDPIENSST
jgi:FkbM family methyltransferase